MTTAARDTVGETSTGPTPRPRLLLRNRDYTSWWIGGTVSDFGSALSVIAYPMLILVLTGSAARAGTVGAAVSIGGLVTMLLGGVLADRLSRRTILTAGPLIQALAVSTVVVSVATGHVNITYLSAVGFVQGLVSGLAGGAELATLRRVVPEEQLPTAFAQYQGRTMAVRLAGPSASGFLFSLATWAPFLGDALSFLAGALGAVLIRRPLGPDPDERGVRQSVFASIGAGLRFIRRNAYLRFLMVWVAIANARNAGLLILVVVLIHSHHGSATLVGAVSSIGAIGGLTGSLLSSRIAERVPGRLIIIALSWIAALVFVGIALVPSAWMIAALLALMMFLTGPINVVFGTYEARIIPDALMGRVSSAISFGAASIQWLGPFGAGFLAEAFGPKTATLAIAGLLAVVAVGTQFARGPRALAQ
ncbi:MFS transporter [Rugosimonospora acidiphila]|uniref:MFS transporter n=1 Tax=Rugosimonospora acidiphila TaxID=556531 RepID=A0ABP9SNQ7_9ACTN